LIPTDFILSLKSKVPYKTIYLTRQNIILIGIEERNNHVTKPLPSLAFFILILGIFCLEIIASARYHQTMWGLHCLYFIYPKFILHILVAAVFLVIIIFRNTLISVFIALKSRKKTMTGLAVVVFGCILWFFRAKTTYLGDGDALLIWLKNRYMYHASDAVDFFVHAIFYQYVLAPHGLPPIVSYIVISSLMGIGYLLLALAFVKNVASGIESRFFALSLMLFSGYIYIFFGYVESYAMYFVLIMAYLYTALLFILKRTRPRVPLILLVITICLHQTGVLLIPSALYLVWLQARNAPIKNMMRYPLFGLAAIILAITFIFIFNINVSSYTDMLMARGVLGGKQRLFLPLFHGEYAVFGFQHLVDFFNEQMLVSPVAFFILPVLLMRKETYRDPFSLFLVLAFSGFLLFFFIMDPKIGMYRDWDLFSVPALVYTCFAAYHIARGSLLQKQSVVGIALVGLLALHTLSWIMVNSSQERSTERFKALVQHSPRKLAHSLFSHNHEQIAHYHIGRNEYDSAMVYLEQAIASDRNPRFLANRGFVHFKLKEYDAAIRDYEQAIALDSSLLDAYMNLGEVLDQTGRTDQAIRIFVQGAENHPNKAGEFYYKVFVIHYGKKDAENSLLYLKKAGEKGHVCDPVLLKNLEDLCSRLHMRKSTQP